MQQSSLIMHEEDVYTVYRSTMRVSPHSGIAKPIAQSAMYDASMNLYVAREVADWLLTFGHFTEQQRTSVHCIAISIGRAFERAEITTKLRERFARGMTIEDIIERQSILIGIMEDDPALASAVQRLKEISILVQPMDRRTVQAAVLIREHNELYMCMQTSYIYLSVSRSLLNGYVLSIEDFVHVAQELELFRAAFEQISVYPFRRSAKHIVSDLKEATKACLAMDAEALCRVVLRVRHSVYWMRLLHRLQGEVITPLFLLIDRAILYRQTEKLQRVPYATVYRTFEPETIEKISYNLDRFLEEVHEHSDEGFVKPVKQIVIKETEAALCAMRTYRWPMAKIHLARIARTL